MRSVRKRGTRLALAVALALALVAVFAAAAFASDATNVLITGGSLTITNPTVGDFTGVTLDGQTKTTTATVDTFSVTDATGTGLGWQVNVSASPFVQWAGDAAVSGGRELPLSSLSLAAPTVAANGTTSAAPSITDGPYMIDNGTGVKIASAAINAGMGKYDFTQAATPLTLSLPAATTYAVQYHSVVTFDAVTGP
jgi:hypothetical protein